MALTLLKGGGSYTEAHEISRGYDAETIREETTLT